MRRALLASSALLSLAFAAPVLAQEAETEVLAEASAEIVVVGRDRLDEIAGAATVLRDEDYERSQPFSVDDVLRRVPGLYPRGEEGLALRPNIGFRGLNPTRSTEVLLLEDGVPLAYAPYGDNASYYHPPFERFSGVEVLKGAGQIAFGPHTVGGVVNYLTPAPPEDFGGRLILRAGERGNRELVLQAGDTIGGTGLFGSFAARDSDGNRANHSLSYRDLFVKAVRPVGDSHELTFKASAWHEDSQVSYSGLTAAEFAADPYGNPFPNDRFETLHYALSASHGWLIGDDLKLTTVLYGASFDRNWWRQASNSSQRPNDASDPACGGMANLSTTCGNEGRMRQYYSFGVDSRAEWDWEAGAWAGRLSGGVRAHHENQERLQFNGDTPWARSAGTGVNGGVKERNVRQATAVSGFVQHALMFGDFTLTTGARVESMEFERSNKLAGGGRGQERVEAFIPGVGLAWSPDDRLTLFAGAFEGFSPPRVEDVITNAGGTIDLEAEESLNLEAGVRARPRDGFTFEATAFRMDFDNQIVPGTTAGGVLTNAGPTLNQGIEGAARFSSKEAFDTAIDWYADATLTWVGTAEYKADRGTALINGNRLPYAPEWFGRASVGFEAAGGWQAEVEAVHTGEMFADDLNTVVQTANGQKGIIPSVTVFNLAASWRVPNTGVKLTAAVRNIEDEVYIVDRARGILPGEPRTALVGVELAF
ncbi:MAG TPA: TonB-dependent receptor [Caulobacteraceae bacterium]|nr:TonB-dependent receptor [Caulobacteraceae bacterium]